MAEEIAFENGRISDFKGLVTLTLTLDRVILHAVVHHSSTSTYTPNFIEIKETFCGRTYVRMYVRTDFLRPDLLGRLCRRGDLQITESKTDDNWNVVKSHAVFFLLQNISWKLCATFLSFLPRTDEPSKRQNRDRQQNVVDIWASTPDTKWSEVITYLLYNESQKRTTFGLLQRGHAWTDVDNFFGRDVTQKSNLKVHQFPPHLTAAFALPCET